MSATADESAREITRRETRGSFLLWFGVLGAPLAWAAQLVLNYSLEEWFACSPATRTRGLVLGLEVDLVATVITGVLAAVALAAGLVSVRCLRSTEAGTPGSRVRWMAVVGVMNSVLYLIIILFSFGPPLIIGTCEL